MQKLINQVLCIFSVMLRWLSNNCWKYVFIFAWKYIFYICMMDGRVLSGAGVQAQWHSVLETVLLHCIEAQQVGCLQGLEGCPLV